MTTWRGGFRGRRFLSGVAHGIDTASKTQRFVQPVQELPHGVRADGAPQRHALEVETVATMARRLLAGSDLRAARWLEARTADPRLRRASAGSGGQFG